MQLTVGGATDRGPRDQNQDAHFMDVDLGLAVVADGMGGHRAGEVASQMAIDALVTFIRATDRGREITWPFPFDPSRSRAVNRMDAALRLANRAVFDAGEQNSAHSGMGTTIVAALVEGAQVVIGHVGDSRAYRLRNGALQQMTEDHTLLKAVGGKAILAPDHTLRHVLTSGIGMASDVAPGLTEETLAPGEAWLLCSDGVHNALDQSALHAAQTGTSAQDAAHEAVRRALRAGATDNVTAVVMNVE